MAKDGKNHLFILKGDRNMKGISIGLLAGTMALGISACSSTSDHSKDARDSITPGPSQPAAVKTDPVEINIYSNNNASEQVFNENYGNALRKAFPQFTINYIQSKAGSTLPEMIASKTRIDIFWTSIGNYETALFEHGLQFDMTDLIKKHGIDLNRLEPTVIEAMKQISGGKMYGLPVSTNTLTLFYNKDIFNKFGVQMPTTDMTWDQANELARKVTRVENGKQYYGIASSRDHIIRMNQLSVPNVDMTTKKPTLATDSRWKQLFETVFITPSADSGYRDGMTKLKNFPALDQFAKDQSLAMLVYPNTLPTSVPNELKTFDWDIAPMPTFKELPNVGSQSYPVYFGLTSQTKNKDEAMELLKFMVSEAYQNELAAKGVLPIVQSDSTKRLLGTNTEFKSKNYQAMISRKFAPITPKVPEYDTDVFRFYRDQALPLAMGQTDINTAFRTAAEQAEKVIQEKGKK
jgi:multiple sugar transport system substrate-binding protein